MPETQTDIVNINYQDFSMTTEQRLDSIDTRLERLVAVGERQSRDVDRIASKVEQLADTVDKQSKTLERLTNAFAEQARAISSLSQTVTRLVDAAQRSAQASEAAAVVAQDNQNAIRDLIQELKQERNQ